MTELLSMMELLPKPVHWSDKCPDYMEGDALFDHGQHRYITCETCRASPTSPDWWSRRLSAPWRKQ